MRRKLNLKNIKILLDLNADFLSLDFNARIL